MLKTTQVVQTPSVECLLNIWSKRYIPDLSSLSPADDSSYYNSLVQASSSEGRATTANKLKDKILDINCQMAWIQTKTLYAYIPNIVDLNEARRITQFAFRVYRKLVEIYQEQASTTTPSPGSFTGSSWEMPSVDKLAYALEPILLIFQEQHTASKDWRALGFMTTQLNFSNKLILSKLAPAEKVLMAPYLKFVEEQVAIPWLRVCAAAAKYELDSPTFTLVEQMLPATADIAQNVYRQLLELLPHHRSRRGNLSDSGIMHSCLRDLNMFQVYLWLCFLEESTLPIEQELLPLCLMVAEGVEIKWEMTEKWFQVLENELLHRLNSQQQALLRSYTQTMQQIFFQQRHRFGFEEQ